MDTDEYSSVAGGGHYQPATGFNPKAAAECWLLLNKKGEVVPFSDKQFLWPSLDSLPLIKNETGVVTGRYSGKNVAILELDADQITLPSIAVRGLLMTASAAEFALLSHALQIFHSLHDHRHCGRCGHSMEAKQGEWAQVCRQCHHHSYPIISPCVIVAITRGDNDILLVKHHRHQKQSAMHTLVAGFIEPGESAEQAVRREILEETGLEVGKISYQYSQSWPFPHALMLGFHAEYERGELQLDTKELSFAGWFPRDSLPELPPHFTISRQLVDLLKK